MSMQPDLIGSQPLRIEPVPGLTEPQLWIRRLVIWRDAGENKVRDIPLRPGLNIIWSPDGRDEILEDQKKSIGHGSGKTLLCRLIRYCLGEDRLATDTQRKRIAEAFPEGFVGCEVMLDGVCWAILRPLGFRRRHMAVRNATLDETAFSEGAFTGIDVFLRALDQSFFTSGVTELVRPRGDGFAWPVALAWLTRDQECRFNDVLDWRSPSSNSHAPIPASGQEKGPRLEALRALLMAITPQEQELRSELERLEKESRRRESEVGYLTWELERTRDHLVSTLYPKEDSLPEMPLLLDGLRKAAEEQVAVATNLPAQSRGELQQIRKDVDAARTAWETLDRKRVELETAIPKEQHISSQLKAEIPELSYSATEAESQVCPICEVPIDRAIAEGCGLSHKLHDPEACRARLADRRQKVDEQEHTVENLRQEKRRVLQELALARQELDRLRKQLEATETARDGRETAWYAARKLQDRVEDWADLVEAQQAATANLETSLKRLEEKRQQLAQLRDKEARVFGQMNEKFEPIVQRLLGDDTKSRIRLTGNGLELTIDMGGDRTTAAIDSLKVLTFDLTALCLSLEGKACIPAFFIHDSPREADLGTSIYHELFQLVRDLEAETDQPLFQYIVTTTTKPPEEFTSKPWLRQTLHGTPSTERLLGCDL